MNKIGIHNLVLVPDWTRANAEIAMGKAAEIGFDIIEVCIFDPSTTDAEMTAEIAEKTGIGVTAGMALNTESDISSTDIETAKRGEQFVEDAIYITRDMGASVLGGVTYSALHRYLTLPDKGALARVIDSYGRLAEKAVKAGIKLGIEPVNRYESNFINTLEQAAYIVRKVDPDNMFVQMDTYHMNIEEKDIAGSIDSTKDVLGYAHVGESNRGCPGSGTFDFTGYFKALARAGYNGGFTWESFSNEIQNDDITGALALWRKPWQNPEKAAGEALRFFRAQIESAWTSVSQ